MIVGEEIGLLRSLSKHEDGPLTGAVINGILVGHVSVVELVIELGVPIVVVVPVRGTSLAHRNLWGD